MLFIQLLVITRRDQPLSHPLTLSLQPGDCLGVYGHNGCGKSSFLLTLQHPNPTQQAAIFWNHYPIKECLSEYRDSIHALNHRLGLPQALTIAEALSWLLETSINARLKDILIALELWNHRDQYINTLSRGQQQRLALVKFAYTPKTLWLLDEPFTALDPLGQAWLEHQLQTHLSTGGMAIIASHQHLTQQTQTHHWQSPPPYSSEWPPTAL